MNKPIYCPILRFKRGEQNALKNLEDHIKNQVLPLLAITSHEFSPDDGELYDKAFELHLAKDARNLVSVWKGCPAYVDMGEIDPDATCVDGVSYVEFFFNKIFEADADFDIKPVVSINNDNRYIMSVISACNNFNITPVFRATPSDLNETVYKEFIEFVLESCDCDVESSDIIIDMGYVRAIGMGNADTTARKALLALPFVNNWASITLAAGSFPEDLTGFNRGTHLIARSEWNLWLSARDCLERNIRYGDYAIIHPVLPETGFDPSTMNPSASVKYTFGENWFLIRGKGIKKTKTSPEGCSQFFAHADLLCERPEYRGHDFSYGDQKIMSIHERKDTHGSPETWIMIGVNHHVTEIVYQLSSQF